jgi:hypothetical protein
MLTAHEPALTSRPHFTSQNIQASGKPWERYLKFPTLLWFLDELNSRTSGEKAWTYDTMNEGICIVGSKCPCTE